MKEKVFKILSRNDVGETGSHQSGMSIPKAVMETGIFPKLGTSKLNPRSIVEFYEEDAMKRAISLLKKRNYIVYER